MTDEEKRGLEETERLSLEPAPLYAGEGVVGPAAWACAVCRHPFVLRLSAVGHCRPRRCKHGLVEARSTCQACREEREEQALAAAPAVAWDDYDEPYVILGDDCVAIDDLDDWAYDHEGPLPERAWATKPRTPFLDPDVLAESMDEDYGDDESGTGVAQTPGWADLVAAIEAWNARQGPCIWIQDRTRSVILPRPEVDA